MPPITRSVPLITMSTMDRREPSGRMPRRSLDVFTLAEKSLARTTMMTPTPKTMKPTRTKSAGAVVMSSHYGAADKVNILVTLISIGGHLSRSRQDRTETG